MAAQIHAILNKHLGKDHARKTRRPEPEPANPHSPMKYYQLSFEGHQLNRSPRLWKFLVELPESTKGASDEFKATSAARKAGGAELRTDFQIPMMEAKLVPTDAAKPDSAKPITIDDCRVWILCRSRAEFEDLTELDLPVLAERQISVFLRETPKATGAKGVDPIAVVTHEPNILESLDEQTGHPLLGVLRIGRLIPVGERVPVCN